MLHRCVVCGMVCETPDGTNAARKDGTGVQVEGYTNTETGEAEGGKPDGHYEYPDGAVACACTRHPANKVRSAFVLESLVLIKRKA